MAVDLKPVRGLVVLQFLGESDSQSADHDSACFALVVAAGTDVPAKKGDTVLVREYAKDSTRIDDDTVITDGYAILAKVS